MDKEMIDLAPEGPSIMESSAIYLNSGVMAVNVAAFIRNLGHAARAHIDGNYEIICSLVARDAGLGEIGRMGILMTPKLGPRVRIAVITTDLPLEVSKEVQSSEIVDFCRLCKKCAKNCPTQAIPNGDRDAGSGSLRWKINSDACFSFWCANGTDCAQCIKVCPYSHPNNALHNLIRWGIKNNFLFRRLASHLDDFFYGKRPIARSLPDWLEVGDR
jgi:reductive dehalogenase